MTTTDVRLTLPAKAVDDPDPRIGSVLEQAQAKLGFVPNMYRNMANVPGLLETYLAGYDRFRSGSGFSPAEQETVLLAISRANSCEYCMAAHSTIADRSGVPTEVTDALRNGTTIPDAPLDALARFTTRLVETRGRPGAEDLEAFTSAGYSGTDVLQVLLAIAVKTISNYTNHLFGTEVDAAFAGRVWP
jgi:uncharacterized peroxidase-related enzyme